MNKMRIIKNNINKINRSIPLYSLSTYKTNYMYQSIYNTL